MIVNGQFVVPEEGDLSSASAMRRFAESVDARLSAARARLHAATHPDCVIATITSSSVIPESSGWTLVSGWNTVFHSTGDNPIGGGGFRFGNSDVFPNGIYMVGGTLQYYTYGLPDGVDIALVWEDDVGVKYQVTTTEAHNTTAYPCTSRGEEFINFAMPVTCHIPVETELMMYAKVTKAGSSIVPQAAESKLWMYRIRGLEDA